MQKTYKLQILLLIITAITALLSACGNQSDSEQARLQTTTDTVANTATKEPSKNSSSKPKFSATAISLNNQGVGEMGLFDYAKAVTSFEKLVAQNPQWTLAQQNYAIALLNRQKPQDEEKALKIAKNLVKTDAQNLVAHYIVAILSFNQGLCDQAMPHFKTVVENDQNDAYALYFLAQCHLQNGQVQQALDLYQQSIAADSYLRSAYYGSFMAAQRLGKAETAKSMLDAYQKLAKNPKARLAEIKYTRMGDKANAKSYGQQNIKLFSGNNKPPYFEPLQTLNLGQVENYGIINLAQSQNSQLYTLSDSQLNIYKNFTSKVEKIPNLSIKLKQGDSKLAWGDIDNNGTLDVYIAGEHDQLYLQTQSGFQAVDMHSYGFDLQQSKAVRLIDADHDGDLDVLVLSQKGRFEIWNNNLNKTFSPLSKQTHLSKTDGFVAIFAKDIDNDRDVDIILQAQDNFIILQNDRMWDYKIITSSQLNSPIKTMAFSDNDSDGMTEMSLLLENGDLQRWQFNLQNQHMLHTNSIENMNFSYFWLLDSTGNGEKEILAQNSSGLSLFSAQGKHLQDISIKKLQQVKILNSSKGPELLIRADNKLMYGAATKNRSPFMLFIFSGKEDDANSVRSNYSGIGTEFILRNQEFYANGDSFSNFSGNDQDYQPIAIASGNNTPINYLEMEWSDGVYQTEANLANRTFNKITETQRQLSSCPVIFAYNKGRYQFISDVLGVGGIGFAVGRHQYGEPRPWENYLLKANQLTAKSGSFLLQFAEPMEESAYLDAFKLQAIDVPLDYLVTLDERMAIGKPAVTGQLVFAKNKIQPQIITTKSGKTVTQQAHSTDKIAIALENRDSRFLGIVDEQVITMEFTQELSGNYQFIFNGWVEYGYSQTMFAAWQAGKVAQAPTLEYFADGKWQVLLPEFGYPAGMPRSASVAINLPQTTHKLRLRTTMEIYFDELALLKPISPKSSDHISYYSLPLQSAQLKQLGYPKRSDNKQRVAQYDFSQTQTFWDTRYMQGNYSQLGDITPLVRSSDNALAIIAAGESIAFRFQDNLPELKAGYQRYFLLKFSGWAKDMDILTKDGETLHPIPATGKISQQAKQLNKKYNTRFKAGK